VIEERVTAITGSPVRSLRRVKGGGYAVSYRAVAELADGRSVFVKAGAEEVTSAFLRDEQRVYAAVRGPFMPELIGMDEAEPPVLVLEDLSGARWPPPWDDGAVRAVRATLDAVAATPPPAWLPPITEMSEQLLGGWAEIERNPEPFLSLGICSAAWLDASLSVLRGEGKLAAAVAGFFAARAGLPPPPTAPYVRAVQLSQLRAALPWAARELGLPPVG